MDEDDITTIPAIAASSPFMSFDDMYNSGKRPGSSFEEFWEQKRSSSSGGEVVQLVHTPNTPRKLLYASPPIPLTPVMGRPKALSDFLLPSLSSKARFSSLSSRTLDASDQEERVRRYSLAKFIGRKLPKTASLKSMWRSTE